MNYSSNHNRLKMEKLPQEIVNSAGNTTVPVIMGSAVEIIYLMRTEKSLVSFFLVTLKLLS